MEHMEDRDGEGSNANTKDEEGQDLVVLCRLGI
jgi:hypothetical protein